MESLFFQVGTVTPVDDFIALINQKNADRFEEGKL